MASAMRIRAADLHDALKADDDARERVQAMRDLLAWFAEELADIGGDLDRALDGGADGA
jgi:hypothetical protein